MRHIIIAALVLLPDFIRFICKEIRWYRDDKRYYRKPR